MPWQRAARPTSNPRDRWAPRETQAQRFSTEKQAQQIAESMETNSEAKEYFVIKLA
jgi:hypothetical protein